MGNSLQRLQQMLPVIEGIKNDRRRLDQQDLGLQQSQRQLELQADHQRMSQAVQGVNMLQQMLGAAQQLGDGAQELLPQVLRDTTMSDGTPLLNYDALAKLLPQAQQSTAYFQSQSAGRTNEQEQVNQSRILEALGQIPDANIRDAAVNSFSRSNAGMGAGDARSSATIASRETVPDKMLQQATLMGMNLVMTPQQVESFKNDRTRIAQSWEQLGMQKDFGTFDDALGLLEMSYRMEAAQSGGGRPGGSPVELTKELGSLLTEMQKPGQDPGSRAIYLASIYSVTRQMADLAQRNGDSVGAELLGKITNEDMAAIGPRPVLSVVREWAIGSSMGAQSKTANPFAPRVAAPQGPQPTGNQVTPQRQAPPAPTPFVAPPTNSYLNDVLGFTNSMGRRP